MNEWMNVNYSNKGGIHFFSVTFHSRIIWTPCWVPCSKGKLINTMLENVLMAIKNILTQVLAFSYDVLYLRLLLWFPRVCLVDIIILKTDGADINLFLSPNDALGCEFLEMFTMASNPFTLITLTPISQDPSFDPKVHWLLEVLQLLGGRG